MGASTQLYTGQPVNATAPAASPAAPAYGSSTQSILDNGGLPPPGKGMATDLAGLQDTFIGSIDDERKRRAQLAGQEDASGAATDADIAKVGGLAPTNTAATPITTAGYQPTATQGVNFDALKGVDLSKVSGFQNTNLGGLGDNGADLTKLASATGGMTGDATGFDAGAAYNTYAQGAISDLMQNQKLALKDVASKSVGAGRLNTGLFDQDQGSVIQELSRGATSDLAEQAVNAAGITATAHSAADSTNERARESALSTAEASLQGAATARFNTANAEDSNTLDAQKTAASLGITQGQDLATDQLNRAGTIDQTTLDADKATDASRLNQSEYQDTFTKDAAETAASDQQNRTNQLSSDQNQSSNRYLDALTGGINMLQQGKNAKDAASSSFLSGLLGTIGTVGGLIVGGPSGAAIGGSLGKSAGSALG